MKKYFLSLLFLSLPSGMLLLSACAAEQFANNGADAGDGKIMVVASFYPLAEFSRQVGGNLIEVVNVTPAGADPHEFEPSPRDFTKAFDADLFIFNGAGQDPWAEKIAPELENEGIRVLEMTYQFTLMEGDEEDAHNLDPHIWLDPSLAVRQVEHIQSALAEIDPANAAAYQQNAQAYMARLAALDEQFKQGLVNCAQDEIITAHNAFGYMARRYNFHQNAITGLSPEEEPSARRLGELADMAEEKGIEYIFFETLVSPRLSEVLAMEVGAQTLILNPIEGVTDEEMAAGENYVTLMQKNLENLRIALQCQ